VTDALADLPENRLKEILTAHGYSEVDLIPAEEYDVILREAKQLTL